MDFKKIQPDKMEFSPFKKLAHDWVLIGAKKGNKINAMTASWGGFGVLWGKNVAFVFIRPQRYTRELIDGAETFSLSFLKNEHKDILEYFGTASGRDEDKIQKSGLTLGDYGDTPYFEESETVIICRKLYRQQFEEGCFIDKELNNAVYPNKDHHYMYVGEIEEILKR